MQQILNKISNFISKNKGILIFLKNEVRIFIPISESAIPHLLGIKKINEYKNWTSALIVKKIKNGDITLNKIKKDRKISNVIKKQIKNKMNALELLINNYTNINNIFIYSDIKYEKYSSCFVLKIQNAILCLNINHTQKDFYNCHLRSIRKISSNSEENKLYIIEYSNIIDIKFSKK